MKLRIVALSACLWCATLGLASAQGDGWQLPAEAADEKNPIAVTDATLTAGRRLYRLQCERCHGPEGKGNGSDAIPSRKREMDLTNPERAGRNPDGIVFHKIWSGREKPKMPAFKSKLTREQVWTLTGYVQSLRAKS
ncbi:MAG: c-type cytochrome [Acidobacteriota bacterium]|nr:c-type cytochrome [Acidobacteriota bacterium]